MMNAPISPFLFEGESLVRVVARDGSPWFVLADVCRVLEISNPSDAARRLDEDEKDTLVIVEGIPGNPTRTIINESGLWSLVLTSRKPAAKRFKKWVTAEVLPSIRQTGGYSTDHANDHKAELAARRIQNIERNSAVRMVDQVRKLHGAQAAADSLPGIYAAIGIPVNLSRAVVQRELPLQQPPANKNRKDDAA